MNILYVITDFALGGAEVLLVNLANEMNSRGHHVEICVLGSTNLHAERLDPAVRVHLVSMEKNFRGAIKAWNQFRTISRQRPWHVVHAHMFHANVIARLVKPMFASSLLICTAHSNNEGGAMRMMAYRLTDFLSDINTSVSVSALNRYVDQRFFSRKKSSCVYNFIDTSVYRRDEGTRRRMRDLYCLTEHDFAILSVGRLVPEKNQLFLLQALPVLRVHCPQIKVFLVGDGETRQRLEQNAADLGISDVVTFCGSQRNVADWCNLADLFVLTSKVEGFGLVLAESMACECPTISTDVGGCAEVLGESANLVTLGSTVALGDLIRHFVTMEPEKSKAIGKRQRARVVDKFDVKRIADQWESMYRRQHGDSR